MASIVPKPKPGKPVQIQFKKPNQKCTINSLTSTLKKLIPNIKEIKITSKKLPNDINKKKLNFEQVLRPTNMKKGQITQIKLNTKDKQEGSEVEYYPDKMKRKVDFKKIVLVPRHDYKVVAATNKRKRNTPMKDAGSLNKLKIDITSPENGTNELSFEDMIPSSIIHKIKDMKNITSQPQDSPKTDPDLKNAQKTGKNAPKTVSALKNAQKIGKNALIPDPDFKNAQKTSNNSPVTNSDPKNNLKTAPDIKHALITSPNSKITPQKVNRRRRTNLKSNLDLKTTHNLLKSYSSPQMEELEHLINEESLTDEDFMEILTCPSPVWWEDPPDAHFIEEPIARFLNQDDPPKTQDCTKVPSKTTQPNGITQNSPELSVATNSIGNKELIEKRLKLENLLISLKRDSVCTNNTKKNNEKIRKISSDGSELSVDEEDLVNSLNNIKIPIKKDTIQNMDEENERVCDEDDIKAGSDDEKQIIKKYVAKIKDNKSNNNENIHKNEIKTDETQNNTVYDDTASKNTVDKNDNPKIDTKSLIESKTEKKAASPRKSNRISPKKHQLTKYYNLKSKRPRIIKQNPRNKIIIENNFKTNINSQKTPEKRLNKKTNNVSKIKKAYLDLLQNSKIDNNLTPKPENKEIEEITRITEKNTKENVNNITENKEESEKFTDTTKQNDEIVTADKNKSESFSNSPENNDKNSNSNNGIPLKLPKLTKIPQNLAIQSPKSIKSVTSDSTDANSEMDTISDTNIQFIDEYDEKSDELVTVYQIISKNK